MILESIREIRLDTFSIASLNNPAVIQLWFKHRLRPFLPAVTPEFLSCLTTKRLNCNTYQHMWAAESTSHIYRNLRLDCLHFSAYLILSLILSLSALTTWPCIYFLNSGCRFWASSSRTWHSKGRFLSTHTSSWFSWPGVTPQVGSHFSVKMEGQSL